MKIGLPAGSLEEATLGLFAKAGFRVTVSGRSYFPAVDDEELAAMLVKAKEMTRYVGNGVLDCGIVGRDWVLEDGASVVEAAELDYARSGPGAVRWVLAVPESSKARGVRDIEGKRIATELVRCTKAYLKRHGVSAAVEFSWGATEAKPPLLADAVVELTETGASLRANHLRVIDTVLESRTIFIANRRAWRDARKRRKIENILILLNGAIAARDRVGLKMNVPAKSLDGILAELPALQTPTVAHLSDEGWRSVEVIIAERLVRELIPRLKRAGAAGIVEYPLNKIVF